MCLDLPTQILHFHQPRLERHDKRALELVLGPVELGLCDRALVDGAGAELEFASNHVDDASIEAWVDGSRDAKETRVRVAVMEGGTVVYTVVLVQNISVET